MAHQNDGVCFCIAHKKGFRYHADCMQNPKLVHILVIKNV